MVRHVVLLTFQPNTPRADVDAVADALRTLPGRIPELRGYDVGVDLGLAGADGGNADLSIVADVDDVAGYEAYRDHPYHLDPVLKHTHAAAVDAAVVDWSA